MSDALSKTRELLENYENCLKLLEKKRVLQSLVEKISDENEKGAILEIVREL